MATHTRPSVKLATLGLGRSAFDLSLVVLCLAATVIAVLLNAPVVVRTPLALLLVFFVPGYALAAALFPRGPSSLTRRLREIDRGNGISLLDRIVISVGLSVSTVVLAGLLIDVLPTALSAESVLGGLVAVTVVALPIAVYRRRAVPLGERYAPFEPPTGKTRRNTSSSRTLSIVRIALAASLLLAGVALVTSAGATDGQQGVTEFYFETDAADGEAETYPTDLTVGEERTLTVAVGNQEGESIEYTVVGQRQRVERLNGSLQIQNRQEVFRENLTVNAGETATFNTTVSARSAGQYRLVYLLYEGEPPAEPRASNAYEDIHLVLDVSDGSAGGGS